MFDKQRENLSHKIIVSLSFTCSVCFLSSSSSESVCVAASICLPYKCCSWTVQFPLISLNKPCKTTPQNSVRLSFLPVLLHPELQICPAVAAAPLQAALRCRRCAPCCSSCCPSSGRSRGRTQRKEDNLSPFLVQFQISNKAGIFPEGFSRDVFIFMTNCLNASPLKFYN